MTQEEQPLVSVVTPVYNGETYISQAINSVLAQDYLNWELIILDNNSDDGTLGIVQEFAKREPRIQVHTNPETLSQMDNWNRSMSLISRDSKYCKVIHADDWLFPGCLSEMVRLAMENPSVALVSAYRLEEESVTLDGLPFPSTCVPGRELLRQRFLGGADYFGSPSSVMYRSDQVLGRKEFFNAANLHADTEICYEILLQNDFGFVHQVLTFTRRHNETTSTYAKRMQTYMPSHLMMLKKYGPEVLDEQELQQVISERLKNYYRFLGYWLLQCRRAENRSYWSEFWAYHKKALDELGFGLNVSRVITSSGFAFYKALLSKLHLA